LIEVTEKFDKEHEKKLIKAMKELNLKSSLCITWDEENEIEKEGKKIKLMPLWKWLLM
jgi:predicted AAA+ superfamily ATPase